MKRAHHRRDRAQGDARKVARVSDRRGQAAGIPVAEAKPAGKVVESIAAAESGSLAAKVGADGVDRENRSGVNTPPGDGPSATPAVAALPTAMDKEHFGTFLRRARESRELVLADIAQKTKVARSTLELLERGQLADLPAGVYVRGFIRSFARAVGTDETEPLLMYERAVEAKSRAEKARDVTPVAELPVPLGANADDEAMAPRRGLGLAVFVIILLLIATITLSLLLRRPPPSGEGLSLAPAIDMPITPRAPPA